MSSKSKSVESLGQKSQTLFLPPNLKGILLASALTFPKDFGILKDCKLEAI